MDNKLLDYTEINNVIKTEAKDNDIIIFELLLSDLFYEKIKSRLDKRFSDIKNKLLEKKNFRLE
jgi:hypothetical protein